jgi:hypothetical protein
MADKWAYLYKYKLWQFDPYEYILVYERDELAARVKAIKGKYYNSGEPMKPGALELVTLF